MSARQAGATTLTQQSENFGYSRVRLRRIAKLQFGIVNPDELVSLFFFLVLIVKVVGVGIEIVVEIVFDFDEGSLV